MTELGQREGVRMIALCAYPRSGGTLLSTILSNHPDVFVTSELHDGVEQLPYSRGQYSWAKNIEALNLKFGLDLETDSSLEKVDKVLMHIGKHLIYRVWTAA